MDTNLIGLIMTITVAVFLVLSMLIGLIVGFKKNLGHALFNLILAVLLLFAVAPLAKLVLHADLSNLGVDLGGAINLKEYILSMIKEAEGIQELLVNCPSIETVIEELPLMIVSPLLFTVLFWVLKIIVYVFELIGGLIFGIVKLASKKKDKNKTKKHRLLGVLVGVFSGLVLVFATFLPVFGFNSVLLKLNSIMVEVEADPADPVTVSTQSNDPQTEEKPLLNVLIGDDITMYLDAFNSNIGSTIATVTGIKALSELGFDKLTTAEVNGVKITLDEEITSMSKIYLDVNYISTIDFKTATKEEIATAIEKVESLINTALEMKLVTVVGDELIPYVAENLQNEDSILYVEPLEDATLNQLLLDALVLIATYDVDFLKTDLIQILDVVEVVNDNNLIVGLRDRTFNDYNDYLALIKNTNADFSTEFSSKLLSINLINNLTPNLIETGLKEAYTLYDINYVEKEITKENAKTFLTNLLSKLIDTVKSLDSTKDYYVTTDTFTYLGGTLNNLMDRNVISNENYNALLTKVQADLTDLASNLPIDITSVPENLSLITNFETEVDKIKLAFADFETFYADFKTHKDFVAYIQNGEIGTLGKVLDELEDSNTFKDILEIYNSAINYLSESMEGGTSSFKNTIETLKIDATSVSWENELTAIQPVVKEVFELSELELTNVESALNILDLCATLDSVENNPNSTVFSAKMQPLIVALLNDFKGLTTDAQIDSLVLEVKTKLENRGEDTIETAVSKGLLAYTNILIPNASEFSNTAVSDMITDIKGKIDASVNGTLTVNFRDEFNYLLTFADDVNNFQNFDSLSTTERNELITRIEGLKNSAILGNCKQHFVNIALSTVEDYLDGYNDNVGLSEELNKLKDTILNNVDLTTVVNDFDTFKDIAGSLLTETADFENFENMDTTTVANALETIRETDTFTNDFTNSVLSTIISNVNDNAQESDLDATTKQKIENYVNDAILYLENPETEINNSTYLTILDDLYDLIEES